MIQVIEGEGVTADEIVNFNVERIVAVLDALCQLCRLVVVIHEASGVVQVSGTVGIGTHVLELRRALADAGVPQLKITGQGKLPTGIAVDGIEEALLILCHVQVVGVDDLKVIVALSPGGDGVVYGVEVRADVYRCRDLL